jgi:hypothetical protein
MGEHNHNSLFHSNYTPAQGNSHAMSCRYFGQFAWRSSETTWAKGHAHVSQASDCDIGQTSSFLSLATNKAFI